MRAGLVVAIVLGAGYAAVPVAAADGGWVVSPLDGHAYRLSPASGWTDAEAAALALGGHLATVRDEAEQAWLMQTFGGEQLWVGYNDVADEGSFVWADGDPSSYSFWCGGEPNNAGGEDAAVISWGGDGCWNDLPHQTGAGWDRRGIVERVLDVHAETSSAACVLALVDIDLPEGTCDVALDVTLSPLVGSCDEEGCAIAAVGTLEGARALGGPHDLAWGFGAPVSCASSLLEDELSCALGTSTDVAVAPGACARVELTGMHALRPSPEVDPLARALVAVAFDVCRDASGWPEVALAPQ